ncbi:Replication protein A 14 kDa subunit [Frankliniella fusca]|uniref:Replication protein A 14 kDa subunit n=1 Tax=Frankliniella fusca TaxID=407009 RepID=A0AAE1HW47_9NEOP|nr:Replication protein A 14 kDa subunit [Frankliniella fusca]
MTSEKYGTPRTSVTGAMLVNPRFLKKNVRLIGNVVKNTSNTIEVNTGDSTNVRVQFQNPLDEPLDGLIDIYGIVQDKNLIEAESYIIVPPNLAENFDLQTHNEAITFIGSVDNPWTHEL